MIEQVYTLSPNDVHVLEPVVRDENVHLMHMVLLAGEALPVHVTNAVVYMTVLTGTLLLSLESGEPVRHPARSVLKIPKGARMDAKNGGGDTLELLVVKAPAPQVG